MADDILDQGLASMDNGAWRKPYTGDRSEFNDEYPKEDDYIGVVAAIYNIGIQVGYMGALKDQVCVVFELDEPLRSDDYPHLVFAKMTKSMYEEAPIYKLICAAFPGEAHNGLKLRDLIGKCVYGTVTLKASVKKPGKFFVDFKGYKKIPRGMAAIAVRGDYAEPPALVQWMMKHAITEQEADQRSAVQTDTSKPQEYDGKDADGNDLPF